MVAGDQLEHIILLQSIMFDGEISVARNCNSEKLHSRILHDHGGFQFQNLHWVSLILSNLCCNLEIFPQWGFLVFNIYSGQEAC